MSTALTADVVAPADRGRSFGLWLPLVCALALMVCTFSLPGRKMPRTAGSLDAIALVKVAVRMGSLLLLAGRIALAWREPRCRAVLGVLAPAGLYVSWAAFSAAWSAEPSVSLGQALGLLTLVLLSANLALSWRGQRDTSAALLAVSLGLMFMGAVTATAHALSPEEMGLNRGEFVDDGTDTGLVHPSTAAGTAACGVVVLVAAVLLWGWRWARLLLVPGCLLHGVVLVFAAARTPLLVAAAIVGLMLAGFLPRRLLVALVFLVSLAGIAYLVLDPGDRVVEQAYQAVTGHYQRGETEESMSSLSGRTELWEVLWQEFLASPLLGNGYFVTTRAGYTDVWGEDCNLSAHNLALQVLCTTGLVGAALFVAAVGYALVVLGRGLWSRSETSHFRLLVVFCLWNVGQGVLSEAFMGGLYPDPVASFVALGIFIGAATPQEER